MAVAPHVQPIAEWRAHALRVALGLRGLPIERQLELVRTWLGQALAVKEAVQQAERAVKSRLRVRSSRGRESDLAAELAAEAAKSEAARAWLASEVAAHFASAWSPLEMARAALWHAHAATPERWPLTNPQHLVVSASMYDLTARTKSFGALHVSVLALVALGHTRAAIARALGDRDAAQVRSMLRLAGDISLSELCG